MPMLLVIHLGPLKKYINNYLEDSFSELLNLNLNSEESDSSGKFKHLKSIELFNDDLLIHPRVFDISFLRFRDIFTFVNSLFTYNVEDYVGLQRNDYHYDFLDQLEFLNRLDKKEFEKYNFLVEELNFKRFINKVLNTILLSIESELGFFKKNSFSFIEFNKISNRFFIFNENQHDSYITELYQKKYMDFPAGDEGWLIFFDEFSYEALSIFGIDGFINIELVANDVLEVSLISGLAPELRNAELKRIDKLKKKIEEYRKKGLSTEKIEEELRDSENLLKPYILYNKCRNLPEFENNIRCNKMIKTNISDLGKGAASIIQLILKSYHSIMDYIVSKQRFTKETFIVFIIIEEPEVFLHPNWQSKLAEFFVYLNRSIESITILVETHSEYLVRKFQHLVANKEINPKDIMIYYFHDEDNIPKGEKQIKEINIEEDGSLSDDFGPGFFDEATNMKMELLRLKKTQNN
jgi:hypothetical protein